jgi:Spore coat protein
MDEKIMVSDALSGINGCLTRYGEMISQTENQQLRQTLQQMRNEAETSQYELFTLAKSKSYYQPAQKASQDEVKNVKTIFSGNMNAGNSSSGSFR